MQEINIYGVDIAVAHLSFYAYGHDDKTIGIITPNREGINITRDCIITHLQLLRSCDIRRTTLSEIELENGTKIIIVPETSRVWFTGYNLDMLFSIGRALTMEQKRNVVPYLHQSNGNIYNIYAEEDNPPPSEGVKKKVCRALLNLID
jgi:hypothetical protein